MTRDEGKFADDSNDRSSHNERINDQSRNSQLGNSLGTIKQERNKGNYDWNDVPAHSKVSIWSHRSKGASPNAKPIQIPETEVRRYQ